MQTILAHAQQLVYTLVSLMPSQYQRDNLQAMLGLFLEAQGHPLVVLYLVVGWWRVPWSFRVWRGKDTPSPALLGLKLVKGLPKALTQRYLVMILVDTAFGTVDFLHGIRKLKYHAIAGVRCDRQLIDGRSVCDLHKRGQQVRLVGLKFPVSVSWYYLKRHNGKVEKRFVLSTKQLKGSTITCWGRRRWQIEGWFKTAKHRARLTPFWSRYSTWCLSLVSTLTYRLPKRRIGLIYQVALQIYLTGGKLHSSPSKLSCHN